MSQIQFDPRYLAGLFDGEGCVTTQRGREGSPPAIVVKLGVVQRAIPEALKAQFGGYITCQNGKNGRRLLHAWRARGHAAARFLTTVLPWLRIKRRAALLGLDHLVLVSQPRGIRMQGRSLRPEIRLARLRIMNDLRHANRRGAA